MNTPNNVYVVDDDEAVRDALAMLLEAAGHVVETFPGASEFLEICTPDIGGCLILDMSMPGMNGIEMQQELLRRGIQLPILFLSGHGSIPATVRVIKAGAMDFMTKPVDGEVLLARVQEALQRSSQMRQQAEEDRAITSHLAALTEREREVMLLAVTGLTSKEIAQRLAISYRTVEIHRAHVMRKTGASNLLELARIAGALGPR
jgi:RNA polymerase sigma factor (sigma-70 family)